MDFTDLETICSICYAEFLEPDDLTLHIQQVHGEETQPCLKSCQFCDKTFSDAEQYALHLRNYHVLNLKCCKYCSRVFTNFDDHRQHESKHYSFSKKSLLSCSQCQKFYHTTSELENHELKEHSTIDEGIFINDIVSILSSVLNIKALKFLQSLGSEVEYVCVKCDLTTPDPGRYIQHLREKNCKSIVCNGCSSVYKNKKSLCRHLTAHTECTVGDKVRYKQCLECYKMFNVKMWRDHTKHCKAIKCRTCKVVFGSMYELSKHQTVAHPQSVLLESCKYCHREFAGKTCLNKHIERAHKHDAHLYKYTCMYCNAIFKHPKKLFAHFYSTHKDLEPYTCKICDKKFKIRKKFTIHIKLDHKSIGYIETDENYHVFFTDKKSDKALSEKNSDEKTDSVGEEERIADNMNDESGNALAIERNIESTNDSDCDNTIEEEHLSEAEIESKEMQSNIANNDIVTKSESKEVIVYDSSDDDEPLLEIKKRVKKNKKVKIKQTTWNRKNAADFKYNKRKFICNICKKYCYTFQNYHNHVALHGKNTTLKCVKCSETFTSHEDLNEHYSKEHSSSQLTQTLKNFLEKRKTGSTITPELTSTQKFQRTIRKVDIPNDSCRATLSKVTDKLSVKKFIENFTPEDGPKKNAIEIDCSITMKPYSGPIKNTFINIKKCGLSHVDYSNTGLSMPVRYRQVIGETFKVTIKEIEQVDSVADEKNDYYEEEFYEDDNDRNESIPEVAQEIMLEGSEDPSPKTLYIPHRVVLPKLPKEYNKIRIAHLQAEAPYYKIVKVEDVLNSHTPTQEEKGLKPEEPVAKNFKLPDGTKLVTVNPLAHLLGDTPVEKILERSKNKYYHPKAKDFENAIAKAMLKLEKPESFPKKRRKKQEDSVDKKKTKKTIETPQQVSGDNMLQNVTQD